MRGIILGSKTRKNPKNRVFGVLGGSNRGQKTRKNTIFGLFDPREEVVLGVLKRTPPRGVKMVEKRPRGGLFRPFAEYPPELLFNWAIVGRFCPARNFHGFDAQKTHFLQHALKVVLG